MKKSVKKITPKVVSTKPLYPHGLQVGESTKVGSLGNRTAPVNYSKKGK